jgi:hypothetical protein
MHTKENISYRERKEITIVSKTYMQKQKENEQILKIPLIQFYHMARLTYVP